MPASDSSAAARPSSVRIAGWTPRASSRSSSTATWSSSTASASSRVELGVGAAAEPALRAPELERERDEALLRAVVDVALDPAALVVGGRDDARARLLHLLELGAELGVEARVLEREPAAAPAARSSSGSSSRDGSWTSAAIGSPSCSRQRDRSVGTGLRELDRRPAASTYSSRSGSQKATSSVGSSRARASAPREALRAASARARGPGRRRSRGRAARGAAREERDRQGDEADDLPPEEVVVGDPGGPLDEREDALEDGAQREDHGCEESGASMPARPRRRPDEPAHDQRDEEAGEDPPDEDDERLLQRNRELAVLPDQQEALAWCETHVPKLLAAVVDEEDREREEERRGVADLAPAPARGARLSATVTVRNIITSMRMISDVDWTELFERM